MFWRCSVSVLWCSGSVIMKMFEASSWFHNGHVWCQAWLSMDMIPHRDILRNTHRDTVGRCLRPWFSGGPVKPRLHDTTGCQTDWTTSWTAGWMFVYTMQPVVQTVVQPVWQPVVSCKRGFSKLQWTYMYQRMHAKWRWQLVLQVKLGGESSPLWI